MAEAVGSARRDDPFGAVGDYAGSFLIKSAVEVSAGYARNYLLPQGFAIS